MAYGYAKRRKDGNHNEIEEAFLRYGFSTFSLHAVGRIFDLLVGRDGKNYLIEIKDGSKPKSKKQLTDAEKEFAAKWRGQSIVVESVEQVTEFCNSLR